jgi:hypothetical protein
VRPLFAFDDQFFERLLAAPEDQLFGLGLRGRTECFGQAGADPRVDFAAVGEPFFEGLAELL